MCIRDSAGVAEVERHFGDGRPDWRDYLGATRPQHWLKNLLLLVPLLAVHQLYDLPKLLVALLGFVSFSLAASGIYLLNDLFDLSADRRHPDKKARALASGRIPLLQGLLLVPALWLAAALLAGALSPSFVGVLAGYVTLMLAYTMRLKTYPIVDTLVLAVGYSLRIYAGSLAVAVAVSPWLLVCSTALFFGCLLYTSGEDQRHRRAHARHQGPQQHLDDLHRGGAGRRPVAPGAGAGDPSAGRSSRQAALSPPALLLYTHGLAQARSSAG